MEFLQPYSCSVGHGDLRKSISNACRLRSVLSLEVHAARASVHPAQPDRRSYTRDIPQPHPLSESVPHDLNSVPVAKLQLVRQRRVPQVLSRSCANARRWPIAPWSMHRARHQRVAFARPSAHASAPPLSTPPCHPDARGTVYTELSVSSMVYVGISYVIDERMNKTCPKEPSSRVLSKR